MNDHQLSVFATPQEVNAYLEMWVNAGGDLNKLPIVKKIVVEVIKILRNNP